VVIHNNFILTIFKDRPAPFTFVFCFHALPDDGRFGQPKRVVVLNKPNI
jgi:hypothetical protein